MGCFLLIPLKNVHFRIHRTFKIAARILKFTFRLYDVIFWCHPSIDTQIIAYGGISELHCKTIGLVGCLLLEIRSPLV